MSPEEVQPFDLQRMFFGDLPWLFALEVVFRTSVIYLYTVVMVRWISKRAIGQLSLVEFLLVIALGSAVGDPMFYHDVPIFHAMIVITVVVLIDRLMLVFVNSGEKLETLIEGSPSTLVQDGIVRLDQLQEAMLSQEKLFEKLRCSDIEHLGEIRWAFLEQGGEISVARAKQPTPGLRIVPPWDIDPPVRIPRGTKLKTDTLLACQRCGHTDGFPAAHEIPPCPNCDYDDWTNAVSLDAADE